MNEPVDLSVLSEEAFRAVTRDRITARVALPIDVGLDVVEFADARVQECWDESERRVSVLKAAIEAYKALL